MRTPVIASVVMVLVACPLRPAVAQPFDTLREILQPREVVIVIDGTGEETTGRVVEVSAMTLVVTLLRREDAANGTVTWTSGENRSFDEGHVSRILRWDPAGRQRTQIYPAVGEEVRISLRTGDRPRGRLVSIASTEVVALQGDREVHYPLDSVRKVERVSHHVRTGALVGVLAGLGLFAVGSASYDCGGPCSEAGAWASILLPISLGVGTAVGAAIKSATADRRVLYLAPGADRRFP